MKRYLFLILFLSVLSVLAIQAQSRKKVAVVLSGGGAKGVAHVGALKVIEEAGIPIDMVVGTSMGSIVGGLYSIGYTPHQMDSMITKQDWSFLLSDRTQRRQKTFMEKTDSEKYVISIPFHEKPKEVIPDGIIKGINLNTLFSDLTIGYHDSLSFDKLPTPFACVAVDLMKGEEVVFHSGKLADVMRASMAIPAVFTPTRIGEKVLVDGGLLNNFPVDVAKSMGADIIIGVDVQSGPEERKADVNTVMDLINKITDLTGKEKYSKNLEETDLYIKVDVRGYTAASFTLDALDTLMVRGEAAARLEWEPLNALKHKIGIPDDFVADKHGPYTFLSKENPVFIRDITFSGIDRRDAFQLIEKSGLQENSNLTMDQLQKAVDALYSLQTYSNICYNLKASRNGYDLEFVLEENTPNVFNLGIRFDTEEIAAVQVNGAYQFKTKIPTRATVTGRLGRRALARLDYELLLSALRALNVSYMYQYNDVNIYNKGRRTFNTTYSQHTAELGYSSILSRNFKYGFGLRYEYFNYNTFLFNNTETELTVKPEGFFSYFASLRYETMDMKSFPNKGTSFQADFSLYTDNLATYDGHTPFGAVSGWWETVFPITRRFVVIPSFYGRVIFGQDSPYPYMNAIGGDYLGRYVPQQMPFAGVNYVEIIDNSVFVGGLKFRQRMGKNNFVSLTANYGLTDNDLDNIFKGKQLFGIGVGYGYRSFFGPIDIMFNVSNRTKKLGFYANVGYTF